MQLVREMFSVVRLLRDLVENRPGEQTSAGYKHCRSLERGTQSPRGVLLPGDALDRVSRRDLTTDQFEAGGSPIADGEVLHDDAGLALRPAPWFERVGVRVLDGLQGRGEIALHRQTSASEPYWLEDEMGEAPEQEHEMSTVGTWPHTAVGRTAISRQLLKQASVSVEQYVRDELIESVRVAEGAALLQGEGADGEPLGLTGVPGVHTRDFAVNAAPLARSASLCTEP